MTRRNVFPKVKLDRFTWRGLVWGTLSLAGLTYEIFFRARELFVILGYSLVLGISLYYIFVLRDEPHE
ncbi:MAG: hypothetical protein GXO73_12500 [Calditrichaeota bacterium]|nr:hypothetical protein [Calditrichota bacterium]